MIYRNGSRTNRLHNGLFPVMDALLRDALVPAARPRTAFAPSLDVSSTEKTIELHFELPGLSEDDVSITLEDGKLVVSGERTSTTENEGRHWHRRERRFGSFRREVGLPEEIDADGIAAVFDNGLLTVTVPRLVDQAAGPRRIAIQRPPESLESKECDAAACDAGSCDAPGDEVHPE